MQNGGWCAASFRAAMTFDKYGNSTACKSDGEGGLWANQVYVIKGDYERVVTVSHINLYFSILMHLEYIHAGWRASRNLLN